MCYPAQGILFLSMLFYFVKVTCGPSTIKRHFEENVGKHLAFDKLEALFSSKVKPAVKKASRDSLTAQSLEATYHLFSSSLNVLCFRTPPFLSSSQKKVADRRLVEWLMFDVRPPNLVEDIGFVRLCDSLGYKPLSRPTIAARFDLADKYLFFPSLVALFSLKVTLVLMIHFSSGGSSTRALGRK